MWSMAYARATREVMTGRRRESSSLKLRYADSRQRHCGTRTRAGQGGAGQCRAGQGRAGLDLGWCVGGRLWGGRMEGRSQAQSPAGRAEYIHTHVHIKRPAHYITIHYTTQYYTAEAALSRLAAPRASKPLPRCVHTYVYIYIYICVCA